MDGVNRRVLCILFLGKMCIFMFIFMLCILDKTGLGPCEDVIESRRNERDVENVGDFFDSTFIAQAGKFLYILNKISVNPSFMLSFVFFSSSGRFLIDEGKILCFLRLHFYWMRPQRLELFPSDFLRKEF